MESLTKNVERLKAYQARLILFPRRSGQFKKGDSSKEEVTTAKEGKVVAKTSDVLPITNVALEEAITEVKRSEMPEGEKDAYKKLRMARSDARLVGVREKRAKAKAEEAAAQKK